jgi:putative alpha-1,2-mannosidase
VAKNNSHDNKYIGSLKLNGKLQSQLWFRHADILKGLTITAGMSDTPDRTLGSQAGDLPPSSLALDPQTLQSSQQSKH